MTKSSAKRKTKTKAPRILVTSVELVPVGKLEPHPDNPNEGDVETIRDSIEQHGFYGLVLAQRSSGRILVGSHRWMAAQETGLDVVPVGWLDVDDDEALEILLVDNRSRDVALTNEAKLEALLLRRRESERGLAGTGYHESDLEALVEKLRAEPPEEFPSFDDSIDIDYRCPKCGYEWSGQQAP